MTALNAIEEATITADSPATAASTCTIDAVCTPSTDTRPARVPWALLRVMMNRTDGPGTTSRTIAAAMNTGRVDKGGTGTDGSQLSNNGRCIFRGAYRITAPSVVTSSASHFQSVGALGNA